MIILNEDYAINVTDTSYDLVKTKVVESGKNKGEISKYPIGYFASLSGALRAFGREMVKNNLKSGSMSLTEALKTISETNKEVTQIIDKAVKGAIDED